MSSSGNVKQSREFRRSRYLCRSKAAWKCWIELVRRHAHWGYMIDSTNKTGPVAVISDAREERNAIHHFQRVAAICMNPRLCQSRSFCEKNLRGTDLNDWPHRSVVLIQSSLRLMGNLRHSVKDVAMPF